MRYILLSLFSLSFLLPLSASAETEEEEMARFQRELNQELFPSRQTTPAPPPVVTPPPASMVAAPPQPTPVIPAEPAPIATTETIPLSTFTNYQLAGVTLGMAQSDVMSKLKEEGYACNIGAAQNMGKMMGRSMCIYASMEAPKMAMFTLRNGQIRDFELHESYKTGFPEEIFKQAKQKFIGSYGDSAKCKSLRRGEVCEIFGHGYRIVLRTEAEDDEAKIIHSVHTM